MASIRFDLVTLIAVVSISATAILRADDKTPVSSDLMISGFSTSAGYVDGTGVAGRANSDSGWNGSTWWISDDGSGTTSQTLGKSEQVTPASPDGGLALHLTLGFYNETWAWRTWGRQLSRTILIEQFIRVPADGMLQSRPGNAGTPEGVAVHWRTENGFSRVMDGNGDGTGTFENTGFTVKPLQWHKVSTLIDQKTKTYRFFVDNKEYVAPDPLNFRGGSEGGFYINRVDYLADSEAWLDGIRVSSDPEAKFVDPKIAEPLLKSVAGKSFRGKIGKYDAKINFQDKTFVVVGDIEGDGSWTQDGLGIKMTTATSRYSGKIYGERVKGLRFFKDNRTSEEWNVRLDKPDR